jgi:hypothetical protein
MGELGGHHPSLHTAGWFIEVHDFIEFDILVALDESEVCTYFDEFDSFIFYFHVGMEDIDLFESLHFVLFFEIDTKGFIGYSEDSS